LRFFALPLPAIGRRRSYRSCATCLIEGGAAHFGRIAGLAVDASGALLVAEDSNGVIYRISYPAGAGGDGGTDGVADAGPDAAADLGTGLKSWRKMSRLRSAFLPACYPVPAWRRLRAAIAGFGLARQMNVCGADAMTCARQP
jgi:hypothetical protein